MSLSYPFVYMIDHPLLDLLALVNLIVFESPSNFCQFDFIKSCTGQYLTKLDLLGVVEVMGFGRRQPIHQKFKNIIINIRHSEVIGNILDTMEIKNDL